MHMIDPVRPGIDTRCLLSDTVPSVQIGVENPFIPSQPGLRQEDNQVLTECLHGIRTRVFE